MSEPESFSTVVIIPDAGVLLDLHLTDRTRRTDPAVVARAVLWAVQEARLKAAEQAQQIAVDALGPDSLVARTIAEQAAQQAGMGGPGSERG